VDFGAWMRSQEFQIQEGDCGDYWGVAGGVFDVPAAQNEKGQWVYDEKGELHTFKDSTEVGRRCIKNPDGEKPYGEWNTIDLYCMGDSAIHVVNGVVVMRLYHSRQSDKGKETSLVKGKIQLQSEGSEIYYRAISIEKITKIPDALLIH
jgi:predicted RecA/RadA family phage recombinase